MSNRWQTAVAVGITVAIAGLAASVLTMLLLRERTHHDLAV
ncbi:hypothetical protein [Bifidobacterium oedipodis]|nr:hypothetical protein [Bifidobacterium sp. DSM 109957]